MELGEKNILSEVSQIQKDKFYYVFVFYVDINC